jgi:hypothetical protein
MAFSRKQDRDQAVYLKTKVNLFVVQIYKINF